MSDEEFKELRHPHLDRRRLEKRTREISRFAEMLVMHGATMQLMKYAMQDGKLPDSIVLNDLKSMRAQVLSPLDALIEEFEPKEEKDEKST